MYTNQVLATLTREQLYEVMRDCGYGTDGMRTAKFVKMTEDGKFAYAIRYDDPDDEETGLGDGVYLVWIENNKIVGDFGDVIP